MKAPPHAPLDDAEIPSADELVSALRALLQAAQRYGAAAAAPAGERAAEGAIQLQTQARAWYSALHALGGAAGHFAVALETRDGAQHHSVLALQRVAAWSGGG